MRNIQVPDPFPARRTRERPVQIVVFPPQPRVQRCLFQAYLDSLPPSERGKTHVLMLSCPCPRCSPGSLVGREGLPFG